MQHKGLEFVRNLKNRQNILEIRRVLLANSIPYKEYKRQRIYKGRSYTEYIWYFSGDMATEIRRILPDKHPTLELLWKMTQKEKVAFFE